MVLLGMEGVILLGMGGAVLLHMGGVIFLGMGGVVLLGMGGAVLLGMGGVVVWGIGCVSHKGVVGVVGVSLESWGGELSECLLTTTGCPGTSFILEWSVYSPVP